MDETPPSPADPADADPADAESTAESGDDGLPALNMRWYDYA
jgi:hypothetical protein